MDIRDFGWKMRKASTEEQCNKLLDHICTRCTLVARKCDETVCRFSMIYEERMKEIGRKKNGGDPEEGALVVR